ncbi:hypothetical protein HJC23_001357 [Cyclotella cryptica]|uniref:Transmembrane protein 231 n=1 Tax=Cyclotella cryptica TaxID=29204 RepID=A0ABD3PNB5_9STRA|eukprot:CCRYP_013130-RA/>CCRYP_013130-RA protein AED:0.06 eAED:0.06 QI:84/-1/1/1/-1/1/1/392/469
MISHEHPTHPAALLVTWLILFLTFLLILLFIVLLPLYTLILASITIIRQKLRSIEDNSTDIHDAKLSNKSNSYVDYAQNPWGNIATSLYRGSVFHIRHKPTIHSFSYPLFFSVVDLDEATELFGDNVHSGTNNTCAKPSVKSEPETKRAHVSEENNKGRLWPLSTLMMLRDEDHLKNGEGLSGGDSSNQSLLSLKERITNLLYERTHGKVDLRLHLHDEHDESRTHEPARQVLLVTHLMYYGYCFNPVSLYYILRSTNSSDEISSDNDLNQDSLVEIEAIVVEVSNTPWNEMSVYVLHPDSVDVTESQVTECPGDNKSFRSPAYRYKFRKNFHVSPFMTMDYNYDWTFRMTRDRIQVSAKMIRQQSDEQRMNNDEGALFFTAGFDIRRTPARKFYPLQLAMIICRYPIYCFIIQIWIHYEAMKLLIKGVQFIPHPEGSETMASRMIAAVMRPVFAVKEMFDDRLKRKSA